MDDQLYKDILHYHTALERKYPASIYNLTLGKRSNAKTNFRRTCGHFNVENGVLKHMGREVLVKTRLQAILHAYHDNATTGGHFGRDKTYGKIAERYYWYAMKKDVTNYIKRCKKCFATNPKMSKESEPLHPIPVPSKVWSLVGIDIIGPLPETKNGNKYIVAATDHFTKWSEAAAIPDKSGLSVALFIYSSICKLGCMDTVITDQGREFNNELNDKLLDLFQSEHRITSAYHPQSNGQRERDNRTLKDALSKVSNEKGDDWDQYIQGILFAYSTSIHSSINITPFKAMYNRDAKLPLDPKPTEEVIIDGEPTFDAVNQDTLRCLTDIKQSLQTAVAEKIKDAQKKQKKYYDRRHDNSKTYNVGSTVYIKNSARIHRMGDKMKPRFTGPYTVVKCLGKGRVKLRRNSSGQVLKNTYSMTLLKRYPDDDDITTDDLPSSEVPIDILPTVNMPPEEVLSDDLPSENVKTDEMKTDINPSQDVVVLSSHTKPSKQNISRSFKPPLSKDRNKLAAIFGLKSTKSIRFRHSRALGKPRCKHKTIGDGNCFFRCISYILTGAEDAHLTIRNKVTDHMSKIQPMLKEYLDRNPHEYVEESDMTKGGIWATDAEIMATANLLGCDILVYSMKGGSMDWLNHPASFSLQNITDLALYIENENNHYDVVINVV